LAVASSIGAQGVGLAIILLGIAAAGQPQIWWNCPQMRASVWFLGLILLALAVMAGLTYPVWQLLQPAFGFPFHRVADRLGMVTLGVGFFLVARRLRLADRNSLGFGLPPRQFLREAGIAFAIGVLLMGCIIAIMLALHLRLLRPGVTLDWTTFGKLALEGLLRGVAVVLVEETFLRGAMWTGIARESGALTATVLTSLLYALTHFVTKYHIPAAQVSWHSGLDMLAGSFGAFARPLEVADAYVCLFAVGVVLATVRMRTGNIAASLGLHAGWVWVITFVRETSVADPASPLHALLSQFDGVVGWLVCAWTVLVGLALSRFYRLRVSRP
jgi:membrane protease YdiL (CAAX protease family)